MENSSTDVSFVLAIAFEIWALYSGYKLLSGRSAWLDEKKFPNMLVKFILCVVVGNIVAPFYFFFFMIKVVIVVAHLFRF